jgi:uncharacterized protein
MLYLDSSALVKLYVNELFSIEMQQLAQVADQLLCHVIGYVEVRAAFASAERGSRISRADYMRMVARFKRDWLGISQVEVDQALLERAADFAEGFGLRGYDSLHLAAADRARQAVGPILTFTSFDHVLNRSARLLGMHLPDFVPSA